MLVDFLVELLGSGLLAVEKVVYSDVSRVHAKRGYRTVWVTATRVLRRGCGQLHGFRGRRGTLVVVAAMLTAVRRICQCCATPTAKAAVN